MIKLTHQLKKLATCKQQQQNRKKGELYANRVQKSGFVLIAEEKCSRNSFTNNANKLTSEFCIYLFISSPGTNVLGELLSYPRRRRRCRRRQFQVKVFVY